MLDSTPSGWRPRGHPYPHIIYMAQSKSFFGLRRGSTKSLTFSVYNGKQVTKDRVTDVKNPRSSAQMKQRAIMATALRGYSALQEICDHSFEGVTYGQKSMNYFVAENAKMIRSAAPKVNLSLFKGNSVSNAYIISKGSLPAVEVSAEGTAFNVPIPTFPATDAFTYGALFASIGATKVGDMITFVQLTDNPGGNASVYWVRITLTENNMKMVVDDKAQQVILRELVEGVDFETNIDNFSPSDFNLVVDNETAHAITLNTGTNAVNSSFGVILSRKSDTSWLRSSSTMVNLLSTYNYNEAIATYPENGEKILNGGKV